MDINESRLTFRFSDRALKFDDTHYYRSYFNAFPQSKGVDVISGGDTYGLLLEIKNFSDDEPNQVWRLYPDNQKLDRAPPGTTVHSSLDIECAQKVAMTLACLWGAETAGTSRPKAEELLPFAEMLRGRAFARDRKRLLVVLFLEGQFKGHTRTKKMMMLALEQSLRKKLQWLKCRVSVVDSATYPKHLFQLV